MNRIAVVGSGIAGLATVLALAPRPVLLVTRSRPGEGSSTALAQGGIAAALGADDSPALHLADTLAAGDGLCDSGIAGGILSEAADAIAMLERHGVYFDRGARGAFLTGLEAAHSRRRILHAAGDGSGAEILRALLAAVAACPSVKVMAGTEARRILTAEGAVAGLLLARGDRAEILPASQVVLATGGTGGLYEATTNPPDNFGQGLALAARAGAALADMEFVQFHPTALALGRGRLGLISEAVRGEGATLIDDRGHRFMATVPGGELAPRDLVARRIDDELSRGRGVFLDARRIDGFETRFPAITALCRAAGIDPARQPIPVRPAAHYHMGGIRTDAAGRSTLNGLWALGECAATGLHGANRLASNSLLEAAVMAARVARDIPPVAACRTPRAMPLPLAPDASPVRPLATRALGIRRDAAGLREAIAALLPLATGAGAAADPALVALAIAVFAAERRESRGAHARSDFPGRLPRPARRSLTLDGILRAAGELTSAPALEELAGNG